MINACFAYEDQNITNRGFLAIRHRILTPASHYTFKPQIENYDLTRDSDNGKYYFLRPMRENIVFFYKNRVF